MELPTVVLQCTTCRGFVGYGTWKRAVYCTDDACIYSHIRVQENQQVIDQIAFLRERWGMTSAEIARALGVDTKYVINTYTWHRKISPLGDPPPQDD